MSAGEEELIRNIDRVLSAIRALPEVEKVVSEVMHNSDNEYEVKAWIWFRDKSEMVALELY